MLLRFEQLGFELHSKQVLARHRLFQSNVIVEVHSILAENFEKSCRMGGFLASGHRSCVEV